MQALPRLKLSEQIANRIRQLIADRVLVENDEIGSEAELIARFDASRPSVREAVRILEAEGLVKIVKGARSVRVQMPSPMLPARYSALVLRSQKCRMSDAYRARTMLEPAAVRELIGTASDAEIAVLDQIVADEIAAAASDPLLFSTLTVRFHEEIARLSGNKTTHLLLTMMRNMFESHFKRTVSRSAADNFRKAIKAHRILIHLIRRRKAAEAEDFWKRHLEGVEQAMARAPGYDALIELQ